MPPPARHGKRRGGHAPRKGKRRRRGRVADEDESEDGSGGAKEGGGGGGARSRGPADGETVEEEHTAVPAPRKPGFSSLLQALGVEENPVGGSDSSEGGGEEEEEEIEEPGGGGAAPGRGGAEGAAEPEEALNGEGGDEKQSRRRGSARRKAAEGPPSRGAAPAARRRGARRPPPREEGPPLGSEEEEDGGAREALPGDTAGIDFHPQFWDEPGKDTKTQQGLKEMFALPGLARCRARRCPNIGSLLKLLGQFKEGAEAWKQCELAPGLRSRAADVMARKRTELAAAEGALFFFLHAYVDVSFSRHSHLNSRAVRLACMLHAVDHVLRTRPRPPQGDAAVAEAGAAAPEAGSGAAVADQGFTRARVLVLCPFRSACCELLSLFLALYPKLRRKKVINGKRFEEEFGPISLGAEDADPPAAASAARSAAEGPAAGGWHEIFEGNNDDRFRIGLAASPSSVRLYAPFEKSDIIFASPLGLREITGAEGDRKREYDFLSSIEVCIIDRADVLRMQNWQHVEDLLQVVNCRPHDLQNVDISRLRPAYAEGRMREFRQTVVTSCGESLDVDALFDAAPSAPVDQGSKNPVAKTRNRWLDGGRWQIARNGKASDDEDDDGGDATMPSSVLSFRPADSSHSACSGRGVVHLSDPPGGGALSRATALGIGRQFFLHVRSESLQRRSDALLAAFEEKYWRPLGSTLERLLIITTSYFDFLRMRKWLREEGASFCSAFEYSSSKHLGRARSRFGEGQVKIMLLTERFLWYRRCRVRGANYVLFCGPPETGDIYEHVLSAVRTPSLCNSMCLYTAQDALALERIVGQDRARRMLAAEAGKVFVFS